MTDLEVTVDLGAAEPPYEQVRTQIAGLIATGRLGEGDRLPTVRALAADLGTAANTVARAYKEARRPTGHDAAGPGRSLPPAPRAPTSPCRAVRGRTPSARCWRA